MAEPSKHTYVKVGNVNIHNDYNSTTCKILFHNDKMIKTATLISILAS